MEVTAKNAVNRGFFSNVKKPILISVLDIFGQYWSVSAAGRRGESVQLDRTRSVVVVVVVVVACRSSPE